MSTLKKVYLVATILGGGIESPLVDFTIITRTTLQHAAQMRALSLLRGAARVSYAGDHEMAALRLASAPHLIESARWNENLAGWVLVLVEGRGKVRSNATARREFNYAKDPRPAPMVQRVIDDCAATKDADCGVHDLGLADALCSCPGHVGSPDVIVSGPTKVGSRIKAGDAEGVVLAVKPSRTAGWEIVLVLVDAHEGKNAEFVVWSRDIESGALQSGHYSQTLDTVTLAVFAEVN